MRSLLTILALFTVLQVFGQGSQQSITVPVRPGVTEPALLSLPNDYGTGSLRYPLLVFLHGAGDAGTDLSVIYNDAQGGGPAYFISQGTFPTSFVNPKTGISYKFIILSPQHPTFSTTGKQLDSIINYMVSTYRIDTNRIYVTGLSAGGVGIFDYVTNNGMTPTHKAAAMVIMSQASDVPNNTTQSQTIADSVRVWGFGSETDIYGRRTHLYVSGDYGGADACSCSGLGSLGRFTAYAGGHCCWNNFYTPTYKEYFSGDSMNIYQWMLQFTRQSLDTNSIPVVNTFSQSVGTGSAVIGSTIVSKNPVTHLWTKLTTPSQVTKKVVVAGSSTAAGNGSSTTDSSFVGKFRNYALSMGLADSVINLAVAGTNVFDMNIITTLNRGGDIYLFAFPSNNYDTASASTVARRFQVIKDSVEARGKQFFISGTQPRNDFSNTNRSKQRVINDSLRNRFGNRFIDFFTATVGVGDSIKTAISAGDGLHFNDAGHEILFQNVVARNIFKYSTTSAAVISDSSNNNITITGLTAGTHKFLLSVWDSRGFAKSAVAAVTVSEGQQTQYINVNFYNNSTPYLNSAWNNVLTSAQRSVNLNYSDGSSSNIYFTTPGGLDYAQRDGYTTSPLCPNQVGQYAQKFILQTVSDTIKGLDTAKLYDFHFYASHPSGFTEYTRFKIGTDSVDINNNNNTTVSADFTGKKPSSSGQIIVKITAVNFGAYIAGFQIVEKTNYIPPCTGTKYVATPGYQNSYYDYAGSGFPLAAGDTLVLPSSTQWGLVEIHDRHGTPACPIVIINSGGQTLIGGDGTDGVRRQIKIQDCSYIKITGSGSSDRYGFKIRPYLPGHSENGWFGMSIVGKTKGIEIDSVEISNAGIGISIEQDGVCDTLENYPYNVLDSMTIHHNYIHRIWNEGMYLGNTNPDNDSVAYPGFTPRPVYCGPNTYYYKAARAGHMKIYNNTVDSTGRGGIQLSAVSEGISEVYNNLVKHSGMNGDEAQGTGISIGLYTKAYIHNNTVSNTYTWGIASLGGSGTGVPIRIENNSIDSSGYLRPYSFGSALHFEGDTTTISNSLNWPYSIFMKTATQLITDSIVFYIKNNGLGLRKSTATGTNGSAGIGFANYSDIFHRSGSQICGNFNTAGGTPTVNVETGFGLYSVNYATDGCSGGGSTNQNNYIRLKRGVKVKIRQ